MSENMMKAWVLQDWNRLEYTEVPVPKPSADEILIHIESACLCNGSDPGIYHGHEAYHPPFVFGHESCGRIVEKGSNVKGFEIGDRVSFWFSCGAFAEYQTVNCAQVAVFKVPDSVPTDEACIIELVVAACRALMKFPAAEDRKSITICGLGPSGLTLIQYAKLLGYEKIIAWDLYEQRRRIGLELGADEVYNPAELTAQDLENMHQSDISVVMMGNDLLPGEPTVTQLMRVTRCGGTIVSYGHPEKPRQFSPFVFQCRNLTMTSPEQDMNRIREKGREIMQYLDKGKMRITPLVTHHLHFEDIGEAFQKMLAHPDDQIKVVFTR